MPLGPRMRPFPLSISTGIDICHIPRIATLLKKDNGAYTVRLLKKVLNPMEQALYRKRMFFGRAIADRLGGHEFSLWRGLPRTFSRPLPHDLNSQEKSPVDGKLEEALSEFELDGQQSKETLEALARFWRSMSEEELDNQVNGLATWLAGR